jgi:hypothetical protein
MSKRNEIEKLMTECEAKGVTLTATYMVERARDEAEFPALNKHLWQVDEAILAQEARVSRAHRLLVTLHVTTGEGVTTRLLMHTRGTTGYQPVATVTGNPDLAATKLKQLTEDIGRARARLRAFQSALPEDVTEGIDEALEQAETRAAAAIQSRQPELAEAAA